MAVRGVRPKRAWALAAVALALLSAACGSASDQVGNVADDLAERGVVAFAEGRWRCETDEVDGSSKRHLTTDVAIGANGRFTYEVVGEGDGPQVGTWSVKDLKLRVMVPWDDDGMNGFYGWTYDGDADPPTQLSGRRTDSSDGQELDVTVTKDRITLSQDDVPGPGGPNYDWDVTCTRTSTDPGTIPPTIPTSDPG